LNALKIQYIEPGSTGEELGLTPGDEIISINGKPIPDVIAYRYLVFDEELTMLVKKTGGMGLYEYDIEKDFDDDLGVEPEPMKVARCNNRCVFCFVHQMPKGMRRTLYVKDEDYRHSFLYGNYITLTTLTEADYGRIIEDRLSPLYVSVHATDEAVRKKLLGNKKAAPVMVGIRRLVDGGIKLHTQAVVCPGINDGEVLSKTIEDLAALYPGVESLAVVPVGLTAHRERLYPLRGFTKRGAEKLLDMIAPMQKSYRKRLGVGFVYPSDELYIKAGRDFPKDKDYDGYPQIDNGVGLVRDFLTEFGKFKRRLPKRLKTKRKVLLVTGKSFASYMREIAGTLNGIEGLTVSVLPVRNRLFGDTVTVAGLVCADDIAEAVKGKRADFMVVPSVMLRDGEDVFLDDVSPDELIERAGMNALITEPTAAGLIEAVRAITGLKS